MTQPVNLSRRSLLQGRGASDPLPIRPPGALREALFTDVCTACGDCIDACPQHIIRRGSGGFPDVDLRRAECTFCSRCIEACSDNALRSDIVPPWRLQLNLSDKCLAQRQIVCETCRDACAEEAIRFRPRLGAVAIPDIDAGACTGCGACIAACPENALQAVVHD